MIRPSSILIAAIAFAAPLAYSQSISSLQPSSAPAGSGPVTVTINGQFFQQLQPMVFWFDYYTEISTQLNIVGIPTSTQIVATIPASLLTQPEPANIYVTQGSGTSNFANFTVTNGPLLSNLSPNSAPVGSPSFTLTVNGANFPAAGTSVTWNGQTLQTNYINSGQLTATVPASLLTAPGTASVNITAQPQPAPLTFTITAPLLLNSLVPNSVEAGSSAFTLQANGSGFTSATTITWNGSSLTTSLINSGVLIATVQANLVATPGTASVDVAEPGRTSPAPLTFTITGPLQLNNIVPNSVAAGSAAFTLQANGSGFTSATTITWNGSSLSTNFVNSSVLTTTVPANLVATAGSASVGVAAPGQTSPAPVTFTINPALTLTGLSPNSAVAGSPGFTITLNGTGFTAQTFAFWNSTGLTTTFVNSNQMTATVPANLIATAGTASVTAQSSSATSNALQFNITAAAVTLTSISPNTAVAGSAAFTLTANGSGFTNGSLVTWNGSSLSTTFVSGSQLMAAVPSNLISSAGSASVGVSVPGQTSPSPLPFTITSGISLTSISPNTAVAGSAAFTLTANGSGFTSGTLVTWNGSSLSTTFVSGSQLMAAVPANLISSAGSASVGVSVPGQTSPSPLPFTITSGISLTSLSPNTAVAGSAAFTLTVNGSGFPSGTLVTWNGSPLSTTFVSGSQLTAAVPANLISTAGTASVGVSASGQTSPAPLSFVITASLSITSISPNSASAGGPAFNLTVNGTGFVTNTIVFWNSTALVCNAVSAVQLTAAVPANLIAQAGTASITAQNGSQVSNAVTFTVNSSGLNLTSVSPNAAVAGGPDFTLTANGSGFTNATVITWNGSPLSTTFVSTTQLTATVPANLIATQGAAQVDVSAPGLTSPAALSFAISPTLTLTGITPTSAAAGGPSFSLTVTGAGFTADTTVLWNGLILSTTVANANVMIASVPANLIAQQGAAAIAAQNSTAVSNSLIFAITGPVSFVTLSSLSPNSVPAGSPAFIITVIGSGFSSGNSITGNVAPTVVTWNGSQLSTTFISSTQLTAVVPAALVANVGFASVSVTGQPQPASLSFTISNSQSLTLTAISPSSVSAGGPAFSLTVNGSGFTAATTVTWNGSLLITTFISSTQLVAAVPASFIASTGTAAIDVSVPAGQTPPTALQLSVIPGFVLTSLSPSSATAGGAAFTLTVNGAGFASGAVVSWNGAPLTTTFVSATQLTAAVSANLIAQAGSASVTVSSGNLVSNALPFTIAVPAPVITSISPATITAGGPAITLTVNGTGFISGGTVSFNGTPLTTTFVSGTQVTAGVPASLTLQDGTAQISFANPSGPASNSVPLIITPLAPVISSINPATVVAGGPAITLTVTGTGFISGAAVSFNTTPLTTTFVSATQLTATVPANLIAQSQTAQITVANPNGARSNAVSLAITAPIPTITSISPSTVAAGSVGFTLTVTGTNYLAGAIVSFNSTALNTRFVSATQLSADVPGNLIAQAGTAQIRVANTVGAASNAVSLTITAAAPTITSISPASVPAGGPTFNLTVNGTNFVSGSTVSLGTTALTTTFVSSTQLTAGVPASLILQAGTSPVTVTNPGSVTSNPVSLTITPPVPTITSISPTSVTAGGPAFTLTVNGSGFLTGAVVLVNGANIGTTIVSSTQLTAQIQANLIAQPGTLQITVGFPNSAPSNAVTLTVTPAPPTLTSISPQSANVGDPAFTLTLTGTGFVQASIAQWNGAPLGTTFVSSTQLTATVDAGRLILPGTASVTVANQVPGGPPLVTNALTFTINAVTPAISSISPNSATAGGPAFSMTVNGSGFVSITTVQWNTTALTTHFVSATQVTADVPASLLTQAGTVSVTAVNPGNSVSAVVTFTINPPAPPSISSLSPTSTTAGNAAFTLTVTGSGFTSAAVVNFGSTALTTTFVSGTQITAAVPATLLLAPATLQVVVQQGGTSSTPVNFTVSLPPAPSLRLNPPATSGPAQQPTIDFGLNVTYPIAMSGTVTLTFASNATVPVDDPSIQFATGGRTFTFTVPPNTTTLPALLIQTGTVSGVITLKVTLTAAGVDVTPATGSTATITVGKSAPVIRTVTLVHANGYLEVDVNGFSTPRDMATAVFTLNPASGASLTTSTITVPVAALFTGWYQSAAATAFGSQFTYAQPFTVIGDTNQIQSVTVTLTNSAGTSVSATSK